MSDGAPGFILGGLLLAAGTIAVASLAVSDFGSAALPTTFPVVRLSPEEQALLTGACVKAVEAEFMLIFKNRSSAEGRGIQPWGHEDQLRIVRGVDLTITSYRRCLRFAQEAAAP